MLPPLMGFDLLIAGMIAVAIVLTGQAIVSYEIFTGKALPRGGLLSYWRRTLILAAGYGALLGATLSELPVAQEVNKVTTGQVTGDQAAKEAQDAVTQIQDDLG
jgi:hypothetical protein